MAWTQLQSASHTAIASASVSVTFGSNVSAGTKLIALVSTSATGNGDPVVKDGAGNTFTKIASVTRVTAVNVWLGYLDTPAGDVGTMPVITATFLPPTADGSILVQEISGLLAGNAIDGTPGVSVPNFGAGTYGPPVYASSAAGEYLAYCYGDSGGPQTWAVPSGYTGDANGINANSHADVQIGYKNSTNGTETGSWVITGTGAWSVLILVAFHLHSHGRYAYHCQPDCCRPVRPGCFPGVFR